MDMLKGVILLWTCEILVCWCGSHVTAVEDSIRGLFSGEDDMHERKPPSSARFGVINSLPPVTITEAYIKKASRVRFKGGGYEMDDDGDRKRRFPPVSKQTSRAGEFPGQVLLRPHCLCSPVFYIPSS
eukprot:jgi/Botrbrau1/17176/Bobra.0157s0067.1